MKGSGSLTIRLTFDSTRIAGAHLNIPLLGIDEHLRNITHYDHIPAGTYDGVLTTYLTIGKEVYRKLKFKVQPDQDNLFLFNLSSLPLEVLLRPIDAGGDTILHSELKVEGVDPAFRPVIKPSGLAHKLAPGEYEVKVLLPSLDVASVRLKIADGIYEYDVPIEQKKARMRKEPRFPLAIPVALRTQEGEWLPSRSLNLSTSGICCRVKAMTLPGDKDVFVRLFVPISKAPLECYAKICWKNKDESAASRLGLELILANSERDTLNKWLTERINSAMR
ncbi:MAG: hypothetical protein C5B54_03490 [Acidobacteria bacterium]|nr:MAG: hypothetical protein C5B54_03490 [Acidobacteriota bacterium]